MERMLFIGQQQLSNTKQADTQRHQKKVVNSLGGVDNEWGRPYVSIHDIRQELTDLLVKEIIADFGY